MGGHVCKIIILLSGMPGSGKSVFAEVARKKGVPVISLGDVVREEVVKRGLEPTLTNLLIVANDLRRTLGKDAIAKLATSKISSACLNNCVIVVDGVRSLEEVETLKKSVDAHFMIVAIHASPKTRFTRIVLRGRQGDPKNFEEFKKRDFEELAWGMGNVIALADAILINEDTLEQFISNVESFLLKVTKDWCT
jgi:dephospho-CoA kinase